MLWRILKYVEHLFHRQHIKGRRINSPYLFEFVHDVLFNARKTVVPQNITELHQSLRFNHNLLQATTLGEQSSVDKARDRTISSFVKNSSVSPKYGAMLFRVSHWFNPEIIIELGTGVGISTMYLAAGAPHSSMHTIEGNPARAAFAMDLIKRSEVKGVKVHQGEFEQKLMNLIPELKGKFLAFVDGNHRYDTAMTYVRSLVVKADEEAVIIMDDIYWSREMFRAWNEVKSWSEVRVSIDLYRMGILLLRKDLHKAHKKIIF